MADSKFSLSSIFGWLKGFLSRMPSPLSGYSVDDVKVNTKGDIYSALFSFKASSGDENLGNVENIKGEAIPLNVLVRAINAQEVFSPLLSGLNNIDHTNDSDDTQTLFNILLGDRNELKDGKVDNTLAAAEARGEKGGLLGVDLSSVDSLPDDGFAYASKFWSWKTIAESFLKYSLECQAPGKKYGAIENQSYEVVGRLISEYLVKVGITASIDEVKIDQYHLILPILICIQGKLKEYYQAAYDKYEGEFVDPNFEISVTEDEYNNAQNPKEPENQAVFDENGTYVDQIDISTPEGQAKAGEYANMGYTVGASKQIKVTLKKITASEDIEMLALTSTCPPRDTLNYVDDIINQEQFFETLTEEPQSFNIEIDNDGYDIEQCECCEVDPCDSIWSVMQTSIVMYRNLYVLHWMAKGNDMMKLHLLTEEMYEELIKEIDTLGELMVEKCGTVKGLDFEWSPIATRNYEFQESLVILKDMIQNYVDTIDCAYPNQTSDVQSTLDEWLRYWNKQMNYFIKNQEE